MIESFARRTAIAGDARTGDRIVGMIGELGGRNEGATAAYDAGDASRKCEVISARTLSSTLSPLRG